MAQYLNVKLFYSLHKSNNSEIPADSILKKEHISTSKISGRKNNQIAVLKSHEQNRQKRIGLTLMRLSDHNRPKMKYHSPWKLKTVIAGHHGWVRCIDIDRSNEFFVTGSTDRTIKFWDLATGNLNFQIDIHVLSLLKKIIINNCPTYFFNKKT